MKQEKVLKGKYTPWLNLHLYRLKLKYTALHLHTTMVYKYNNLRQLS